MLNRVRGAQTRMRPVATWEFRSIWTDGSVGTIFDGVIVMIEQRKDSLVKRFTNC